LLPGIIRIHTQWKSGPLSPRSSAFMLQKDVYIIAFGVTFVLLGVAGWLGSILRQRKK